MMDQLGQRMKTRAQTSGKKIETPFDTPESVDKKMTQAMAIARLLSNILQEKKVQAIAKKKGG